MDAFRTSCWQLRPHMKHEKAVLCQGPWPFAEVVIIVPCPSMRIQLTTIVQHCGTEHNETCVVVC